MGFCGERQQMCVSCKDGECILDKCNVKEYYEKEHYEKVLKEELLPPPPPEESKSEWPKPLCPGAEDIMMNEEEAKEVIKLMREEKGKKNDKNKPRFSLLPWDALEKVVEVMEYGAKKYEENNWKHVKNGYTRYINAAYRHLSAMMQGKDLDPESGLTHIAHATTCLLFSLALRDSWRLDK